MDANYINEIITGLTAFAAAGGLGAIFNFKSKKQKKELEEKNKELENENKKLIDKEQTEFIGKLENTLNTVVENQVKQGKQIENIESKIKDSEFIRQQEATTSMFLTKWLKQKEFYNSDLISALTLGRENLIKLTKIILYSDFKLTNKEVYDNGYILLKTVKDSLIQKQFKNKILFLDSFEEYLKKQLDEFSFSYENYKNLQNGERRGKLAEALIFLFESIVKEAIDKFNEICVKQIA